MNYDDPTWRLVDVYVWTNLETSVGITSACLPTLREYSSSGHYKAKTAKGPLFGSFFPGASTAESSDKKDSQPSSQRAAKAQFHRLFEESGPEVTPQNFTRGTNDPWTSPDMAAGNELSSMNRAPTGPLHSVNSTSQTEDPHYPPRSTRRANYE